MVGDIMQPTHLLFVLVVALVVLGPKRLPEVGRTLGAGIRDFRQAISGESHETPVRYEPDDAGSSHAEHAHEDVDVSWHDEPITQVEPGDLANHEPSDLAADGGSDRDGAVAAAGATADGESQPSEREFAHQAADGPRPADSHAESDA